MPCIFPSVACKQRFDSYIVTWVVGKQHCCASKLQIHQWPHIKFPPKNGHKLSFSQDPPYQNLIAIIFRSKFNYSTQQGTHHIEKTNQPFGLMFLIKNDKKWSCFPLTKLCSWSKAVICPVSSMVFDFSKCWRLFLRTHAGASHRWRQGFPWGGQWQTNNGLRDLSVLFVWCFVSENGVVLLLCVLRGEHFFGLHFDGNNVFDICQKDQFASWGLPFNKFDTETEGDGYKSPNAGPMDHPRKKKKYCKHKIKHAYPKTKNHWW